MQEIHIRKRETKKGFSYEYRFGIASIGGKRKYITKSGFKTKAEAKEAAKRAQQQYEKFGEVSTEQNYSVFDLVSEWIAKADIKTTTRKGYLKKAKNYIYPVIGNYRASSVTQKMLQEKIINSMYERGFSVNTIQSVAGILTKSFDYGVYELKTLPYSCVIKTLKVKNKSDEKEQHVLSREDPHVVISKEDFKKIIERFPEGSSAHIPLVIGYSCGLRLGEVFALTWDDIDLEKGTLTVNKQVQWVSLTEPGTFGKGGVKRDDKLYGYWYFSLPKYNSVRTIGMSSNLIELLKREKERQRRAKEYLDHPDMRLVNTHGKEIKTPYTHYYVGSYNKKDVMTTDPSDLELHMVMIREDGTYISPRTIMHASSVIKKQLGVEKFDFHSLRHTHATQLANSHKYSAKYIQERMGHKNITTTFNVYIKLTEATRKAEDVFLDDIF